MFVVRGLLGLLALIIIAWLCSENRRRLPVKTLLAGLSFQILLALLLLKLPGFRGFFLSLNQLFLALDRATAAGTGLVFGYLGGGPLPFVETTPGSAFILGFRSLPLVLVMSALSALLFYWRVLPLVVRLLSGLLRRVLPIGGAVAVGAAANIFVGMVEAPLLIRPYLKTLSRSELFMVMTCGMSTIAGTMLVLYAGFLQHVIPDALGHILIASLISAPAAIVIAQVMVPPDGPPTDGGLATLEPADSAMDAVTRGTSEGLKLWLNILAMLIVLVALVYLANELLGLLPAMDGRALTLQRLLGWLLAPVAWVIGIPWQEATTAGSLLGTKVILNELLAYLDMARLPAAALSERSRLILAYALCGFANFGSLGIMIGGMGTMVPERRSEIVNLGLKSIMAGTLATCMTGAVIGML
ncbi:sodium/nucleoside symporter family protein [Syntrophotalea carbinolica DSM 2380]|uniref:Sodium/nucleoside symporter family protein n=1 Tax=Syntrophotalea carbinolica (strain DSM 2380 / NBRC 103641 / GraBd1) TaxID=338963 RepID=Q3A7W1_SYNC1|nr:nucleoside transporter C-terminal domain-containing protein [Syntrophotalea carbinolica]ABA87533.1 sodium/nucleoside symporter family protein [Syntrophotalea carbinolica DSM 2380]